MTPFLTTTTTVQKCINEHGPDMILMSVEPSLGANGKAASIDLVIGATYYHQCASSLSKKGVLKLAALLIEIADAMEDK
jgi:hypothetical protein